MSDAARLERPGAGVVIGVIVFVVSVFGLIGGVMTLSMIGEIGGPPAQLPGQALSMEEQVYAGFALYAFGLLAGVMLMRAAPSGVYLLGAMMLAMMALSLANAPNVLALAPYVVVYALVLMLIVRSTARPGAPTPALWVTIFATIFLTMATTFLMVVSFSSFLFSGFAPVEADVAPVAITLGVLTLIAWVIGAAFYKFRWTAATIGWPALGAGATAGTSALALAAYGDNPAVRAQLGPELDEMIAASDPVTGGVVSAVLAVVGFGLVLLQNQRDARRRQDDATAIQEAFR
ncbi:MAG: hypothetical protein AAGM38_11925 [Pseudomonadota bacterium]